MIFEKAYAKVNLALEVRGKREDGYHDINTLMLPLELHDVLSFEKIGQGIEIEMSLNIKKEDNFIYKAAVLFFETYKINGGVRIIVEKNIPEMAGLAGGSSDAAATLRGLNRLFDTKINLKELADLSALLGSDMPFCVYQQLALCKGRGTEVDLLDIEYPKYHCTLIKPNFGLSTAMIYKNYCFKGISRQNQINNIIKGLADNNLPQILNHMFNDLMEVSLTIKPELRNLVTKISNIYPVLMSGSGPTLFILSKESLDLKPLQQEGLLIIPTILR